MAHECGKVATTAAFARIRAGVSVAARVPRKGLRPVLLLYLALTLTPTLLLEITVVTNQKPRLRSTRQMSTSPSMPSASQRQTNAIAPYQSPSME
jgi:hypothetical protein